MMIFEDCFEDNNINAEHCKKKFKECEKLHDKMKKLQKNGWTIGYTEFTRGKLTAYRSRKGNSTIYEEFSA